MNTPEDRLYTRRFFDCTQEGSGRSARAIAPIVIELLGTVRSVVDVGCGVGTWLAAFDELGVSDYLGVDGDYVDRSRLQIPPSRFLSRDLRRPLSLDRVFDLVCSLEVAEHLPAACAAEFIRSLTRLGPVVLFSAAIPHQGGTGHLNEQWPTYWAGLFERFSFVAVDCIRRRVWDEVNVDPWYAQNSLLFVRREQLQSFPRLQAELDASRPAPIDIVHPRVLSSSLGDLEFRLRMDWSRPTREHKRLAVSVAEGLARYEKNPLDAGAVAGLRAARMELARVWLDIPAVDVSRVFAGPLGATSRALAFHPFKYELLNDEEQRLCNADWPDTATPGRLIAAMLYRFAHELPADRLRAAAVPEWMSSECVRYAAEPPRLFRAVGEADDYARFASKWSDDLASRATERGGAEVALEAARQWGAESLSVSNVNVRRVMESNAKLLRAALRESGHVLDFSPGPLCSPPRVAVVIRSKAGQPEAPLVAAWYEYLDRQQFDVRAYDLDSGLPGRLEEQVATLRADGPDVLIFATDITSAGSPAGLIAAHRIARHQVAVASPLTSGLETVDVSVSGSSVEPADGQSQYSERLICLEGCGMCWPLPPAPVKTLDRGSVGLSADAVVFATSVAAHAITPEVREAWSQLLARVPGSLLLLLPSSQAPWSAGYPNHVVLGDLRARLQKVGVATTRLGMSKPMPSRADELSLLRLADTWLDTFPLASPSGAVDALCAGVPVMTVRGSTRRSRTTAALLDEIGASHDLVASNPTEYVERAVRLGKDVSARDAARKRIATAFARRPSFLDPAAFAAQVNRLLQQVLAS